MIKGKIMHSVYLLPLSNNKTKEELQRNRNPLWSGMVATDNSTW